MVDDNILCKNGQLLTIGYGQRFVCSFTVDDNFFKKPETCKHIKWCAIKGRYEMLPGYEEKCENIVMEGE